MSFHIYTYDESNDDPHKRVAYVRSFEESERAILFAAGVWDHGRFDRVTVETEAELAAPYSGSTVEIYEFRSHCEHGVPTDGCCFDCDTGREN